LFIAEKKAQQVVVEGAMKNDLGYISVKFFRSNLTLCAMFADKWQINHKFTTKSK
jgi:hypothetical protein